MCSFSTLYLGKILKVHIQLHFRCATLLNQRVILCTVALTVTTNLSLCLMKYQAMKAGGEVEMNS